ncbi:MAG: hypothetical protein ACK6DC_20860 [Planctomycetota bacterium]
MATCSQRFDANAPKSGLMVVSHTEPNLDEVLTLLENYRTALKNSKRRISPEISALIQKIMDGDAPALPMAAGMGGMGGGMGVMF